MDALFEAINGIFSFIIPVSNWLWDFPTNYEWWSSIPLLGKFSLAIILLVGSGIFFTIKTGFIQITHFKKGVKLIMQKKTSETGISPGTAFFLSTAMRVGPANIIGVTGAITTGGPGALFWMWISAFFGMATAYIESTLSQIFKKKEGDEFVGGLPYYGRKLLGNAAAAGVFLSLLYILYALCCFPAQGFNTVSAVGQIAGVLTGKEFASSSALYWIAAVITVVITVVIAFGGIKKVTKVTDKVVPIMAVIYCLTVFILIITNVTRIPFFITAVIGGAFKPEAIFGGAFGFAIQQGVKRGLMSNEAGQGTITMPAAASNANHPCEQGCVQAVGVFLDTIVICTLTGFVIVMGQMWLTDGASAWMQLDQLPKFLTSASALAHFSAMDNLVRLLIAICFGLFAYTCLLGFVSFSEICAKRISTNKTFINVIRIICIFVAAFGMVCNMAGYNLSNLWAFSDLGNILIVYFNIPLLYLGCKYAFKATKHFKEDNGTPFTEDVVGIELDYWKKDK